ncbi:MAG TPA: ABC transporter ATP-binding protein [Prolixibacteraceae bacterium]|nr:ABC transporter ATP-binding protein [Prolixibacteraceae bacterium]HPS12285.1 ABC transporter ATP-binding protein [Prolixibacteraceae bacterium]
MTDHVIELVELTKNYGQFTAVDHLNLTIQKGEIFGLLGPNGAGKSTTILMMLGLTDPSSGSVKVCGINSTSNPLEVKRRVGYLPEDVGFYDDRTGIENLIYTARLNSVSLNEARQRAAKLLARVGLTNHAEKKAGKYSKGMRQRLGLADVLIKNPEVIILDEPTSGIDPAGVREFMELIHQLSREEGITVLFSSHHLHQVQQICDRVGIFVSGKLLAEGTVQSLSEKLFAGSIYTVEAGIELTSTEKNAEWVIGLLKSIEGVNSARMDKEILQIECSKDITSDVARTIVNSGVELKYLNKKSYGLDDIYYHYFEGGEKHE